MVFNPNTSLMTDNDKYPKSANLNTMNSSTYTHTYGDTLVDQGSVELNKAVMQHSAHNMLHGNNINNTIWSYQYNETIYNNMVKQYGNELGPFITQVMIKIYQTKISCDNDSMGAMQQFMRCNDSYKENKQNESSHQTLFDSSNRSDTLCASYYNLSTCIVAASAHLRNYPLAYYMGRIVECLGDAIGFPSIGINSVGLYVLLSSIIMVIRLSNNGKMYGFRLHESNIHGLIFIGAKIGFSSLKIVKSKHSELLHSPEFWCKVGGFNNAYEVYYLEALMKSCLTEEDINVSHSQIHSLSISILADLEGATESDDDEEDDDDDSDFNEEEEEDDDDNHESNDFDE